MKKLFKTILILFVAAALAACSASSSSSAPAASETEGPAEEVKDITIGICLSDHTNVSFIAMLDAGKEYAKENGHITIIEQDGKSDPNAMISAIENFTTSGVDAIIYQNSFPEETGDAVREAAEAGIVVIAYESVSEYATVSWISDNETIGKAIGHMAGEWINANVGGEGKVCIICNDAIPFLKARGDAIVDGLKEIAPNSEVIARQAARAITDGYTLAETLLISNPEINCYAGTGDAAMVGVSQAYEAANWDKALGTFGADCSEEAVAAMKTEGTFVTGSFDLGLKGEMVKMIQTCYELCNGASPEETVVVMQGVAVTRDNVLEYFPE